MLGGISGYFGGWIDQVIQRLIEVLRSIPTIPLWMGLAAALPRDWTLIQVYFAITVIISLIGWTELARVVRGRFLSLREEDFVIAAELAGCRADAHHPAPHGADLPQPHHRRPVSLAMPAMIISETSLSLPRPRPAAAGDQLGRAAAGRAEHPGAGLAPWLLIARRCR